MKHSKKMKWDVESYKTDYESAEHWELRKKFMECHKAKFPEDELVCLARVFTNIEFMGCRYPSEVMQQVALLSNDVVEIQQYRKSRRNRLKRTFIGASDAVVARLTKSDAPRTLGLQSGQQNMETDEIPGKKSKKQGSMVKLNPRQRAQNLKMLLKDVIYYDESMANNSISRTVAGMQKIGNVLVSYENQNTKCFYIFREQVIAEGDGENKKESKKAADENLTEVLQQNCYTIKNKLQFFSPEDVITPGDQTKELTTKSNDKLTNDNIGFKMMKMLGWDGGSLGTKNTGIIDPINLEIKIGRQGLGAQSSETFDYKFFKKLLSNFKQNSVEYDLIFSSEFSKEERASIHKIAQGLGLKGKSYGKDESRHMVISQKLSPLVLREKLLEGDPFLLEKYEIFPPGFKAEIIE